MTTLNISIQSQIKNTVESEVEFSVNFSDAWVWLDYATKASAKRTLVANFERNIDYLTINTKVERQITEDIHLTADCFKQLAMLAATPMGREVRLYFIKCEKELKELKAAAPKYVGPSSYKEALLLLVAAEEEKEKLMLAASTAENKIIEMKPKVDMYDVICESGKAVTINEFSSLVNIKKLGRNNMLQFLRTKGILQQNNLPYQQYMHHFNVVQKVNTRRNNEVYLVALVTPSGQQFLVKKLLEAHYTIASNVLNQITKAAELDKAA